MSDSLSSRVRSLVDRVHGGSVNAAARDIGIAQSTLAPIAAGTVQKPRAEALERIATFYKSTPEWLLQGAGDPPRCLKDQEYALAERLRWAATVGRLELSAQAAQALWAQPDEILRLWVSAPHGPAAPGSLPAATLGDIQRHSLTAWIRMIELLESTLGTDATRACVEALATSLALSLGSIRAGIDEIAALDPDVITKACEETRLATQEEVVAIRADIAEMRREEARRKKRR